MNEFATARWSSAPSEQSDEALRLEKTRQAGQEAGGQFLEKGKTTITPTTVTSYNYCMGAILVFYRLLFLIHLAIGNV